MIALKERNEMPVLFGLSYGNLPKMEVSFNERK